MRNDSRAPSTARSPSSTRAGECFDACIVPLDFLQIGELGSNYLLLYPLVHPLCPSVSNHLTFINKQDITLKIQLKL
jgi:hypothetical protein